MLSGTAFQSNRLITVARKTTPGLPEVLVDELLHSEEVLGLWDHGHGELMLQGTLLPHVEGRLADEDGLPVLDGLHRAHAETATVSCAFHLVENRNLGIP